MSNILRLAAEDRFVCAVPSLGKKKKEKALAVCFKILLGEWGPIPCGHSVQLWHPGIVLASHDGIPVIELSPVKSS